MKPLFKKENLPADKRITAVLKQPAERRLEQRGEQRGEQPPADEKGRAAWLLAAALVTVALWQIPYGNYILYPFTILATWFHEMGHGLTALILGGQFQYLEIFPDGSGLAHHGGALFLGPIGQALSAAAGPMGPPVAGALLLLASRKLSTSRFALLLLGVALVLSDIIWVRTLFGFGIVAALGAVIFALGTFGTPRVRRFVVQFLGVQACISTYHQVNYLFTYQAVIGGQTMPSDSTAIANHLLLPYWFWGALMAAGSLVLLAMGLWMACGGRTPSIRRSRRSAASSPAVTAGHSL